MLANCVRVFTDVHSRFSDVRSLQPNFFRYEIQTNTSTLFEVTKLLSEVIAIDFESFKTEKLTVRYQRLCVRTKFPGENSIWSCH